MPGDIEAILAEGLREQDIRELEATGMSPEAALREGARHPLTFTIHVGDSPAGIFGVAPSAEPAMGYPWLLGTPSLLRASRALVRESPAWIGMMSKLYPYLTNMVDVRNSVSIRWLKRMGFAFTETINHNDHLFMRFELCANPHQSR